MLDSSKTSTMRMAYVDEIQWRRSVELNGLFDVSRFFWSTMLNVGAAINVKSPKSMLAVSVDCDQELELYSIVFVCIKKKKTDEMPPI